MDRSPSVDSPIWRSWRRNSAGHCSPARSCRPTSWPSRCRRTELPSSALPTCRACSGAGRRPPGRSPRAAGLVPGSGHHAGVAGPWRHRRRRDQDLRPGRRRCRPDPGDSPSLRRSDAGAHPRGHPRGRDPPLETLDLGRRLADGALDGVRLPARTCSARWRRGGRGGAINTGSPSCCSAQSPTA